MEKFKIYVDGNEFNVKTPSLKGNGNIEFNIFQKNDLLATLRPKLTRNSRFVWTPSVTSGDKVLDKKSMQAIGNAILEHYSKSGD